MMISNMSLIKKYENENTTCNKFIEPEIYGTNRMRQ